MLINITDEVGGGGGGWEGGTGGGFCINIL